MGRSKAFGKGSATNQSPRNGLLRAAADICDSLAWKQRHARARQHLRSRPSVEGNRRTLARQRGGRPRSRDTPAESAGAPSRRRSCGREGSRRRADRRRPMRPNAANVARAAAADTSSDEPAESASVIPPTDPPAVAAATDRQRTPHRRPTSDIGRVSAGRARPLLSHRVMPSPIDVLRARRAGAAGRVPRGAGGRRRCMRGVISAARSPLSSSCMAQRFDAVYRYPRAPSTPRTCSPARPPWALPSTSRICPPCTSSGAAGPRRPADPSPSTRSSMRSRAPKAPRRRGRRGRPPRVPCARDLPRARSLERPHGPLLERLRAAARVPLLSGPPVRLNGCRLYDGGLLSPLPVELAPPTAPPTSSCCAPAPTAQPSDATPMSNGRCSSWLRRAHPETRWMPVVPGGATTPAGRAARWVTAHGNAQVQVIVPHAPPMSQSEMNPSALRAGAWTGLTSVERWYGNASTVAFSTRTRGADRRESSGSDGEADDGFVRSRVNFAARSER